MHCLVWQQHQQGPSVTILLRKSVAGGEQEQQAREEGSTEGSKKSGMKAE